MGKYPVFSGKTINKGLVGFTDSYKYDGKFLTWTTYGIKAGTVFYRDCRFSIGRNCAGLKLKDEYKGEINLKYIKILLQKKVIQEMGSKDCRGNASVELVINIDLDLPNKDVQDKVVMLAEKEFKEYEKKNKRKLKINKIKELFGKLNIKKTPIVFCSHFSVILGKQFSEKEAYRLIGKIPVYTASIYKPSYFVKDNIKEKVKVKGPCLIWGRKGNAGKLNLIENDKEFYITDVSGIITPKKEFEKMYNVKFLKYYLEALFLKEIHSKENNPQLNKTDIESMVISFPDKTEQNEIVHLIDNI